METRALVHLGRPSNPPPSSQLRKASLRSPANNTGGLLAASCGRWVSNDSSQQGMETAKVNSFPSYIKEAGKYKNQQQINEGISNLADDDIIKYLETTGNNADDELLSNVIQENELPDEKDYLLNEHTLETFLNNVNLKNTTN